MTVLQAPCIQCFFIEETSILIEQRWCKLSAWFLFKRRGVRPASDQANITNKMLRRLYQHFNEQDWFAITLELLVVVFALFLGFQLDRWYEGKKDLQRGQNYLVRFKSDLLREIEKFEEANTWAESRMADIRILEEVARTPESATSHAMLFVRALETTGWISFPQISRFVYTEMQNNGSFGLVQSEPLRRAIADHYSNVDADERMGLSRTLQNAYELNISGLLSSRILVAIEEDALETLDLSNEEIVQLAGEFQHYPDALRLLPELMQHHVFNRKLNNRGKNEARRIILLIDEQFE
jgi:hypothetical protein